MSVNTSRSPQLVEGETPNTSRSPQLVEGETSDKSGTPGTQPPIVCPQCGKENAFDAVFCEDPACHKALGEFKYVLEEMRAHARWFESLADKIAEFIGRPHFIVVHAVWFALWVAINLGVISVVRRFDAYPFSLLGIILSIEAIFITGFLLISQNRQNEHSEKRSELDYEVNVHTFREIHEIGAKLDVMLERLEKLEARVRETR
jgi:uncharacterized membrane protein